MAFPEDAVTPLLDCVNPNFSWPAINLPGLPSFSLAGFTSAFAGIDFVLDFLPPDIDNLPSLPDFDLFIDPFLAGLKISGDLGEFDFSLVIPGAPIIPATGFDIQFDQFGLINMGLVIVGVAWAVIEEIIFGIIDNLSVALPTLQVIIDLMLGFALDLGLVGVSVSVFIGCFAQGFLDMLGLLI